MDCQKIGNIIFKHRKEKNLTQKELADLLGISDRTVSKWERGLGCPDISLMIPLSEKLDIELYKLLGGETIEKESIYKVDKVIKNTIEITSKKIRYQKLLNTALITLFSLIVLIIVSLFLYTKFYFLILNKPKNVNQHKLIEYKELLKINSCTLTLKNQYCDLNDGKTISISLMEQDLKLPHWYFRGGFYGFDKNNELKQMSLEVPYNDYKEKHINNYRLDKNHTKKAMIVTSLVYFIFVDDLESISFDFNDNAYLIEKDYIKDFFEKEYVKWDDILKDNNWNKYVINNLNNKKFVNAFFKI